LQLKGLASRKVTESVSSVILVVLLANWRVIYACFMGETRPLNPQTGDARAFPEHELFRETLP